MVMQNSQSTFVALEELQQFPVSNGRNMDTELWWLGTVWNHTPILS